MARTPWIVSTIFLKVFLPRLIQLVLHSAAVQAAVLPEAAEEVDSAAVAAAVAAVVVVGSVYLLP